MRIRLPTLAALLLLAGCASPALKIDTRYDSVVQDSRVQFLILHYTVADFDESVDILVRQGKVSSHYLVREDPVQVYRLVDESRLARHAGDSYWAGNAMLNAGSIGIGKRESLADVAQSKILPTLIEACMTKIFLPIKDVANGGCAPSVGVCHILVPTILRLI